MFWVWLIWGCSWAYGQASAERDFNALLDSVRHCKNCDYAQKKEYARRASDAAKKSANPNDELRVRIEELHFFKREELPPVYDRVVELCNKLDRREDRLKYALERYKHFAPAEPPSRWVGGKTPAFNAKAARAALDQCEAIAREYARYGAANAFLTLKADYLFFFDDNLPTAVKLYEAGLKEDKIVRASASHARDWEYFFPLIGDGELFLEANGTAYFHYKAALALYAKGKKESAKGHMAKAHNAAFKQNATKLYVFLTREGKRMGFDLATLSADAEETESAARAADSRNDSLKSNKSGAKKLNSAPSNERIDKKNLPSPEAIAAEESRVERHKTKLDSLDKATQNAILNQTPEKALKVYDQYKELRALYEQAMRDMEIARLERDHTLQLLLEEQRRHQQQLLFVGVILGMSLLAASIVVFQNRKLRTLNRKLTEKNQEISQLNGILEQINQNLINAHAEVEEKSEELSGALEEIRVQNELLNQANVEIRRQHDRLALAYDELEIKNIAIWDSIHYAQRIQRAILPPEDRFQALFPLSYLYFKPRDVLSGDFYWVAEHGGYTFLAVADCTGHGVPGAFMSAIGNTLLNQIVIEQEKTRPEEILAELDLRVRALLKQELADDQTAKDGMDVALVVVSPQKDAVEFAGAGRGLVRCSVGVVEEFKSGKAPVGGVEKATKTFPTVRLALAPGDRFYLFTDGVTDQFGGTPRRKLSPARLKEFIHTHADLTLAAQRDAFVAFFENWAYGHTQPDDVTLVAVECPPDWASR